MKSINHLSYATQKTKCLKRAESFGELDFDEDIILPIPYHETAV
jgi:hypothetical protein